MEIRPSTPADADRLMDVDGTVESAHYLHVESTGQAFSMAWKLEERPLRETLIDPNPMDEDSRFLFRQIALGTHEGLSLVAEHDDMLVAAMTAQLDHANRTLRIIDLRVDFDHRREGLGSVLLYRAVHEARERELRAVTARTLTNNIPAARFLHKAAFELCGLDSRFLSNHDLVKEAVSLFWYASLD
jgi:ribosomal protein S18 acetylase RimI-like enzyme